MDDAEVQAAIPQIDPDWLEKAMTDGADYMFRSIVRNFEEGGRPEKWQAKRDGTPATLMESGTLLDSLYEEVGPDYFKIGEPDSVRYAAIHNFGGDIPWPGTDNGFGRGIHIGPHIIPMPRRTYLMFQEEDPKAVIEILAKVFSGSVTFVGPTGGTATFSI